MMIKNLIAATYSPMHGDGTINTSAISGYRDFLVRNKVNGAFINGTTGDFTSLSVGERKQITKAWSEHRSPNLQIIDHVGHTNLEEAKEMATHASDKVDAIAAIAPYYFKLDSVAKLIAYCREIARSAPNLPFYYYHIPALSGARLNMEAFLEMGAQQIPNLAGIKFTDNDLIGFGQCKKSQNGKFNILFGYDELFLNSLPVGAKGWVGSTYNHLAPLYHKIMEQFEGGEMEQAMELQSKAIKFVEMLQNHGGYNGAAKSFMKILGVECGPSRFPHSTLSDMDLDVLSAQFDAIGLKREMFSS
ncbi:dihydrodipicolinate synthase family protein [Flagellimonas myxillae]|uniref:dihydrodipicolinate synthase family protein n=1 Tax=Flagellimonas myxillae TaxID=2942214 RepID=UPI00201F9BEE|nr:dihydrodipicolinate synthase family protein [Muricauda myxillae]MCL6268077.1 dihydrodipicolinate synthase family protein [Muricauda myxillae]